MLLLSFASATVLGGTPGAPLPEPGVLELIGIGAIVGVAIALRKRRNK